MAHVSTFGNVPIIAKYYEVAPSSNLLSGGSTFLNTFITENPDDYVAKIMAGGRSWGE